MRLELTGRHVDITPALRRLVDGKLARLDRVLNNSALSAQVVLSREKNGTRADVTLHARGEKFLHGAGKADRWQAAMGGAVEKILQQAQKVKGRWQQERSGRATLRGMPDGDGAQASAPDAPQAAPRRAVRPRMPPILKASRQRVRSMSLADATREISDEGVVVFRDSQTSALAVLYRSSTGELTLVEADL